MCADLIALASYDRLALADRNEPDDEPDGRDEWLGETIDLADYFDRGGLPPEGGWAA